MTLLKVHRLLIISGIVVCLLFAMRQVFTAITPATFARALVAVGLAVILAWYLRSLRNL